MTSVHTDLQVADIGSAPTLDADDLGSSVESINTDRVTRFSSPETGRASSS